ncbi:MAG: hypothetical protein QOG68_1282 [Solirubrobacteraceae bacterium]|jgi:hypothetical protein|nr:hypothetical protein [Solirubrobacteraceae bacterium]
MGSTAGSSKKADRMAKHLGEQIDAACSISPPGATNAQIGANVGGLVGAGIGATRKPRGEATVKLGRFAWLGLGPDGLVVTGADNLFGKPKGDPIVRSSYAAAQAEVTQTKLTLRAHVELGDGQAFAFEVKRIGPANKASVEVVELLAARCAEAAAPA